MFNSKLFVYQAGYMFVTTRDARHGCLFQGAEALHSPSSRARSVADPAEVYGGNHWIIDVDNVRPLDDSFPADVGSSLGLSLHLDHLGKRWRKKRWKKKVHKIILILSSWVLKMCFVNVKTPFSQTDTCWQAPRRNHFLWRTDSRCTCRIGI